MMNMSCLVGICGWLIEWFVHIFVLVQDCTGQSRLIRTGRSKVYLHIIVPTQHRYSKLEVYPVAGLKLILKVGQGRCLTGSSPPNAVKNG